MKHFFDLFEQNYPLKFLGDNQEIAELFFDSRKAKKNSVFFAIPGTQVDGHQFIDQVINAGCTCLVLEKIPEQLPNNVSIVQVKDANEALASAAGAFYDFPSKKIQLVGITGTNGKTTSVTLLFELFKNLGNRCGLISTVQNKIQDQVIPSTHTTPDALQLNQLLAEMVQAGCTHVFMEVSSHAVVQKRIHGLDFKLAIFSNITRDHLDFHQTFDEYIKAKKGFFDMLGKHSIALTNADDKRGEVMLQNTSATKKTYGILHIADFKGKILSNEISGLQLNFDGKTFHAQLIGNFNAYNLLAIYASAILLGENQEEVILQLSNLRTAPGRFEQFVGIDQKMGIVDYAHTPDALENVLKTIQAIRQKNQKIITVIGCGGNRDTGKRPIMAEIASKLSDYVVLTSDNPRMEDPAVILQQMEAGIPKNKTLAYRIINDRREAIRMAINEIAQAGDIILVAGKGHETYQDIQGVKHHFDDKEEIKYWLKS
ncbi:MAG: UDP-N-acetylmuramoyl-L-alanyl-D-glutamate--2,6-diaminopimelate ligase [Bacteroidota bacterium]|jgi:UDP-N-acetylmuramoyl-L-alanyl-D-glutamate--2,6-diaminopimelate ligase